jgi:hypothetical protein
MNLGRGLPEKLVPGRERERRSRRLRLEEKEKRPLVPASAGAHDALVHQQLDLHPAILAPP